MRNFLVILAAGSALAGTPALAQIVDSPFSGPRVEALVGYDATKAGSSIDNDVDEDDDQTSDGLLYGIGAGYDIDTGGVVLGVEGEFTESTAKTGSNNGDPENFSFGRVKTGRDLYVGGRVGVKATPSTLVYAKGGYTNARFDTLATDGETELEADFDTDGWRLGAGVETLLGPNSFAKVEYRYSKYGEAEVDFGPGETDRFDVDLDRHQVVAGVGFRF
jgi:outer membrane immunogenic protein